VTFQVARWAPNDSCRLGPTPGFRTGGYMTEKAEEHKLQTGATIKQTQEKAPKLYQERAPGKIQKFFGLFRVADTSLLRSMAEDRGIFYGLEDQESYNSTLSFFASL